jgi:hypothetical protein
MRIEIEGVRPGLGTACLIRMLAWILVDMDKQVLILSPNQHLDRKFCENPSGGADEYMLDLAQGRKEVAVSDYAAVLHPRLRILESSSVLSEKERVGMKEKVPEATEEVVIAGRFSGLAAKRILVVPAEPAWLEQESKSLSEMTVQHLFVSHLSQENCCQDMYEAYAGFLTEAFTLLPTCNALQREWLEPLDGRCLMNSSYGRTIRRTALHLLYPTRVREKGAVYKVMRHFRRERDGR